MSKHPSLWYTVILPTLFFQLALSMGAPFIPLYARELGSSLGLATLMGAGVFFGQALLDLPGGWLVHRYGEKTIMVLGGLILLFSALLRLLFPLILSLGLSILLTGAGTSLLWLARMSWLKHEIRGVERGQAMSKVGGALRIANIAGPLMGGFIAEHASYLSLFAAQGTLFLCSTAFMIWKVQPTPVPQVSYRLSIEKTHQVWQKNWRNILAAGAGIAGLTVLRTSREILIPLWGKEVGLGEALVGIVIFSGALVDASFFWLSGLVMTRWGRKPAAIMCTVGLGLAIGLLPLATGFVGLVALSCLAGLSNALGAGINLTISGDLAPRQHPAAFLSLWRFFMGFAAFGGPALAATTIRLVGESAAPPLMTFLGAIGVVVMGYGMRNHNK
ncbi:MAG: MFS transporter [Spirochaetales bacterium]|nr:MFS transporter [Spirochaetales bacterium]